MTIFSMRSYCTESVTLAFGLDEMSSYLSK